MKNYVIVDYDSYSYYDIKLWEERMDFIETVNKMRASYAIRIEIKNRLYTQSAHDAKHKEIVSYLTSGLAKGDWALQPYNNYNGLHYIWFMKKEDAMACMLKFNGRIV